MNISIICAIGFNNLIGNNEKIPWLIKEELKYFRYITIGKALIMGRLTYQSIGKHLANRKNIILTNKKNFSANNCSVSNSISQAIGNIFPYEKCMVIGGAQIYKIFYPYCHYMYITEIVGKFSGNIHFPNINLNEWNLVSSYSIKNCKYTLYKRNIIKKN